MSDEILCKHDLAGKVAFEARRLVGNEDDERLKEGRRQCRSPLSDRVTEDLTLTLRQFYGIGTVCWRAAGEARKFPLALVSGDPSDPRLDLDEMRTAVGREDGSVALVEATGLPLEPEVRSHMPIVGQSI